MKKLLYILPVVLLMGFTTPTKVKLELEFDEEEGLVINDEVITKNKGVSTLNNMIGTKTLASLVKSLEAVGIGLQVGYDNKEVKAILLQLSETQQLRKINHYEGSIKLKERWLQMNISERGFKSKYPDAEYNKKAGKFSYNANDMKVEFYFNNLGVMWLIAFRYQ